MKNKKINSCGVYSIRNIINGKIYIGSTIRTFKERWALHKKLLKNNKHPNAHLQNSYNKYKKDSFDFQIIEITTPEKARIRESFYIKKYKVLNPRIGYNISGVNSEGFPVVSDSTKEKLRKAAKKLWKEGKLNGNFKKGIPSWNKNIKCYNISNTRRNMFSSVEVYKNNILIATFRSVTDLSEWTKNNTLPGLNFYSRKYYVNNGKKTSYLQSANIHRAIREDIIYRGLKFKKVMPLSPEIGIVKWENCWDGEIPNQQPSQELTILEGSETNS